MVIYIDILIILNMFISLLIMLCASMLLRERIPRLRLVFSCLFGGAYSLVLLLPDMGLPVSLILKIGGTAVATLIAFRIVSLKGFLRSFFCVLFIGFAFAGIMFAVYIFIKPDNMAFNNGAVYFDISVRVFVITSGVCYLLIKLFLLLLKRYSPDNRICTLTLEMNSHSVVLKALIDTGNGLFDVFTGKPVTTVEKRAVKSLLREKSEERSGVVPVKTALGSGLLETIRADKMTIEFDKKRYSVPFPVIALSETELSDADYYALVNPAIFEIGRNENEKN